jgi:hypothetical protein
VQCNTTVDTLFARRGAQRRARHRKTDDDDGSNGNDGDGDGDGDDRDDGDGGGSGDACGSARCIACPFVINGAISSFAR